MQFYGLGELGFGTLPMFAKVQGIYRENHYDIQENPGEGFPAMQLLHELWDISNVQNEARLFLA